MSYLINTPVRIMEYGYLLGPFLGTSHCVLILLENEIILREYTTKESWVDGFKQQLGFSKQPFSEHFDQKITPKIIHEIKQHSNTTVFRIFDIIDIHLQHSPFKNSITLILQNGFELKFRILQRGNTDFYFDLFSKNYGDKVTEAHKPVTLFQRILKY